MQGRLSCSSRGSFNLSALEELVVNVMLRSEEGETSRRSRGPKWDCFLRLVVEPAGESHVIVDTLAFFLP